MLKSCYLLSWKSCKDLASLCSLEMFTLDSKSPMRLKKSQILLFFLLFFSRCKYVYSLHMCVCMLACVETYLCVCIHYVGECACVWQRLISIIILDLCFSTLLIKTGSLSQYPNLLIQLVLLVSLLWEITVPASSQHLYGFWEYELSSSHLCTSS